MKKIKRKFIVISIFLIIITSCATSIDIYKIDDQGLTIYDKMFRPFSLGTDVTNIYFPETKSDHKFIIYSFNDGSFVRLDYENYDKYGYYNIKYIPEETWLITNYGRDGVRIANAPILDFGYQNIYKARKFLSEYLNNLGFSVMHEIEDEDLTFVLVGALTSVVEGNKGGNNLGTLELPGMFNTHSGSSIISYIDYKGSYFNYYIDISSSGYNSRYGEDQAYYDNPKVQLSTKSISLRFYGELGIDPIDQMIKDQQANNWERLTKEAFEIYYQKHMEYEKSRIDALKVANKVANQLRRDVFAMAEANRQKAKEQVRNQQIELAFQEKLREALAYTPPISSTTSSGSSSSSGSLTLTSSNQEAAIHPTSSEESFVLEYHGNLGYGYKEIRKFHMGSYDRNKTEELAWNILEQNYAHWILTKYGLAIGFNHDHSAYIINKDKEKTGEVQSN